MKKINQMTIAFLGLFAACFAIVSIIHSYDGGSFHRKILIGAGFYEYARMPPEIEAMVSEHVEETLKITQKTSMNLERTKVKLEEIDKLLTELQNNRDDTDVRNN